MYKAGQSSQLKKQIKAHGSASSCSSWAPQRGAASASAASTSATIGTNSVPYQNGHHPRNDGGGSPKNAINNNNYRNIGAENDEPMSIINNNPAAYDQNVTNNNNNNNSSKVPNRNGNDSRQKRSSPKNRKNNRQNSSSSPSSLCTPSPPDTIGSNRPDRLVLRASNTVLGSESLNGHHRNAFILRPSDLSMENGRSPTRNDEDFTESPMIISDEDHRKIAHNLSQLWDKASTEFDRLEKEDEGKQSKKRAVRYRKLVDSGAILPKPGYKPGAGIDQDAVIMDMILQTVGLDKSVIQQYSCSKENGHL